MLTKYGAPQPIGEVKAAGDAWEVSGYVSTFGNVDLGGDVVMKGAFDRSIADWKSGRSKIRFLRQHDGALVLGVVQDLKADETGLFGRFKISKTGLGEETHQLLKDGALDSFSMGYMAREADFTDDGVRRLLDVELLEASIVSIPMNPEAVVTGVKALDDLPFAQKWAAITDYLTYGVDEAKALRARRLADSRDLTPSHLDALKNALPLAEACVSELKGLIDAAAEVEATRGMDFRLELARRRHRYADVGILERIPCR